jgi:type 1 glutamine amidotransferase
MEFDLAEPLEPHVYRWFPNFGGMQAHAYDFAPTTTQAEGYFNLGANLYKRFHLFISGADTSTKIRFTQTFAYSTTPLLNNYDKFPVTWPNCFAKPDVILSKLSSDTSHIFLHKGGA